MEITLEEATPFCNLFPRENKTNGHNMKKDHRPFDNIDDWSYNVDQVTITSLSIKYKENADIKRKRSSLRHWAL